ncbi:MAG TPA: hypothetical protein VKF40_14270 [Burkholderiales bacterium]|nr:hypothetical protein [Burkholderiales bacterium]
MDDIFWIGQFFWLMFLGCGGYLAFVYASLADEESARTVTPERPALPAAQADLGHTAFTVSPPSHA